MAARRRRPTTSSPARIRSSRVPAPAARAPGSSRLHGPTGRTGGSRTGGSRPADQERGFRDADLAARAGYVSSRSEQLPGELPRRVHGPRDRLQRGDRERGLRPVVRVLRRGVHSQRHKRPPSKFTCRPSAAPCQAGPSPPRPDRRPRRPTARCSGRLRRAATGRGKGVGMRVLVHVSRPRRCIVLVAVCAVGALAGCGSSGPFSSHRTSAALTSSPANSTTGPVSPGRSVTRRRRHLGPLGTVDRYWRDIGAGHYAAAFHYLGSGSVPQTQAQFVSDERQAQIARVDFNGRLAATTASSATVTVGSLTTNDAQFGCRTWTGTYQLRKDGDRWLIARASITPTPCSTGQPPSLPTTSTSPDTAPRTSTGATSIEGPGSASHSTDTEFCTTHTCITNFPNGNGYIVQCADGAWSHSGGLSGACSYHGGER